MKRLLMPVLVVAILGGAIVLLVSVPMQDAQANFTYLPFDLVPRDPGDFMPAGAIFNPRWDYLNNIRRNPLWGKQANDGVFQQPNPLVECPDATQDNSEPRDWYGGSRPCTTVLVTQDSGAFCGPHAEFAPVTYEGYLIWEGHSGPYPFDDDDYEIDIFRDDDNALYTGLRGLLGRGRGIEIEFDSDETIDNYDGIPWWQKFHHHVDNDDGPGFVGDEILQRNAIIIAPADLDGSHGYTPELHPAWLFMVQYFPNFGEEHWAFFARNWGDKGYCSDADHQLPLQDIHALIRNPNATDGFAIGDTVAIGDDPSVEGMGQQFIRGQGLAITFHLPPPDAHGWIAGDIHVGWQNADVPPPAPVPHPGPPPVPAKFFEANKSEYVVDRLVLQMKEDQRAQYLKDMQACRPQVPPARGKIAFQPVREALTQLPPASVRKTPIQSLVVPYRGRKPYCRQLALCRAFKGRVPGYPNLCNLTERTPSMNQTK